MNQHRKSKEAISMLTETLVLILRRRVNAFANLSWH